MKSAAQVMTVLLTVVAMAAPSIGAAIGQDRRSERQQSKLDQPSAVDASVVERQERLWRRLSGSICTGCITSANRVALVSYERPSLIDLAQAKPPRTQVAARKPRAKMRVAYLRKRYARLHRRNRTRIAARLHRRQIARTAMLRKSAHRNTVPPIFTIGWSGFDDRPRVLPIERPGTPRDDDRRHETILSVPEVRPRRS